VFIEEQENLFARERHPEELMERNTGRSGIASTFQEQSEEAGRAAISVGGKAGADKRDAGGVRLNSAAGWSGSHRRKAQCRRGA